MLAATLRARSATRSVPLSLRRTPATNITRRPMCAGQTASEAPVYSEACPQCPTRYTDRTCEQCECWPEISQSRATVLATRPRSSSIGIRAIVGRSEYVQIGPRLASAQVISRPVRCRDQAWGLILALQHQLRNREQPCGVLLFATLSQIIILLSDEND